MTRPHLTLVPPAPKPGRYPNPPADRPRDIRAVAEASKAARAVEAWHASNRPWWWR